MHYLHSGGANDALTQGTNNALALSCSPFRAKDQYVKTCKPEIRFGITTRQGGAGVVHTLVLGAQAYETYMIVGPLGI